MLRVELSAIAEDELSDAYDWHETQLQGLGNKLFNEVNHLLTLIEANPEHYPIKYPGDLRGATLSKFSYQIIYWIDETNNKIIVFSIFHTSREPKQF